MQVVLQSWEDILVVLQYCVGLVLYVEQFGIVWWCFDVLVFMVCMEFFDFVVRKFFILGRKGDYQILYVYWWIQDFVVVLLSLFVNLILVFCREGM